MELSDRLKNLSPAKRALLLKVLREDAAAQPAEPETIPRRAQDGPPSLSFAQQRLWFLDQIQPGSGFYNMPVAVRLIGSLDVAALKRSVNEVVRRHEALRTTFRMTATGAVQVIASSLSIQLPVLELRDCSEDERRRLLHKYIDDEAACGFDLTHGPLVRGKILRLAVDDHVVLLTMHHIVGDGWSLGVLLREITALYATFCAGQSSPLPELSIQYADFACWQRESLQGEPLDSQIDYWKERLAGMEPLELPVDRRRPATAIHRGAVLATTFSMELSAGLHDLSRRNGCTLFMTLLAAFQTLLYRYTGQDDISVGTPTANRMRPELESLIGFFANTLVLRTDLSGEPTFVELLGRVRSVVLGAFAHQDAPFEMVVEALQPERTPGRNPLFQVAFALQNAPLPSVELPGLKQVRLDAEVLTTRFDLTLALSEDHNRLTAGWEYSTELFDSETIARMDRGFKLLLRAIVERPETPISRLPFPSLGSRGQAPAVDDVAAAILQDAAVVDCVVLSRPAGDEIRLVAYVVAPAGVLARQLRERLRSLLPQDVCDRIAIVPVAAIPLRSSGRVDEVALESLQVIDDELIGRWEEKLGTVPGIDEVVVVEREAGASSPPLHISDILPPQIVPIREPTREPNPRAMETVPAISHGGPIYFEPGSPRTLQEQLRRAAGQSRIADLICIQPDGTECECSYRQLLEHAEHVMRGLRATGARAGDRVLFQFSRNQDLLAAFWGCVLGGFVPVPAALPPSYAQANGNLTGLQASWAMLDRPLVLCGAAQAASIRSWEQQNCLNMRVIALEELQSDDEDSAWHESRPEDVALIQLTSGSTGLPKGVQLTHRNLIARSASSKQLNGFTAGEVTLNFLPLDHVGGIVYFHLRDVFLVCRQVHAPIESVLEDPLKWLDWIHRYRATVTWAPNFAFGLVTERAADIQRRRWDLSSMRFIANGGEAVVARTAERFLRLLAAHGLSANVMHPAWGMSETASGVTYSYGFSLESSSADPFVEVGSPIPGISLRIVDETGRLLRMGEIGQLQISGDTIMRGYYGDPGLNREAFSADGWFKTGDLGFLRDGRLTITGREKDLIIIGGKNYSPPEIETLAEEIDGVDGSYTAACAVRRPGGADQLAIFFCISNGCAVTATALIDKIREQIVRNAGTKPDYIIPVKQEDIPRTSIGKIQYSELRKRFEKGEYDALLKQVDIETANANTIPDWFFQRVWLRRESTIEGDMGAAPTSPLVFGDAGGFAAKILDRAIVVEAGSEFRRISADHYRIDPREAEHYTRLLQSLVSGGVGVRDVVHLWNYQDYAGHTPNLAAMSRAQDRGVYSLLFLIQALSRVRGDAETTPVRLLVVSNHTQAVSTSDRTAPERAPILGLIRTVPQELSWLDCRHLDLEAAPNNDERIRRELRTISADREIAYRAGRRMVPRLEKVDLRNRRGYVPKGVAFQTGGMYVISGGLGGIGVEVARYLLREYQAHVLLIGRTVLPDPASRPSHLAKGDALARRIESFIALERLSGEVGYEAVDTGNAAPLRDAVEKWKALWQRPLSGIIHLAGVFQERLLLEETRETFAQALHARMAGTWTLYNLTKDEPQCLFVSFASVNGIFGGATSGAYAAGNSFLDSFARVHATDPLHYCFHWSTWDGIGMSRDYRQNELARAHGYKSIAVRQGIHSLLAGLYHGRRNLIIGLDGANKHIRRNITKSSIDAAELMACFSAKNTDVSMSALERLVVSDRFQTRSRCEFRRMEKMPRTASGDIDRAQLEAQHESPRNRTERVLPRNEIERTIAQIWGELLRAPNIGIHDNFFELGGDSILAIQAIARANQAGLKFAPAQLFQHQTIAGLASVCELSGATAAEQGLVQGPAPLTPIQRWFFEQDLPEKDHFNMSLMLTVKDDLNLSCLAAAVDRVVVHHDALRLRYEQAESGWSQWHAAPEDCRIGESFQHVDVSEVPATRQSSEIENIAAGFQSSLDLLKGPLLRVVYMTLGAGRPGRLLIIVHHLVMDGISWRILLQDLFTAYVQLRRDSAVALPPKTSSFQAWAKGLVEWSRSDQSHADFAYWQGLRAHSPSPIPRDHPGGANTVANLSSVAICFSEEETLAVLQDVPRLYHTQINDVLLTALAQAFACWTGQRSLYLDLEGHGREDVLPGIDISRTVGWFTSLFPVRLELEPVQNVGEELKAVKEELRRLPHRGMSYGVLRHLSDNPAIRQALEALPPAEISFNYLGQVDRSALENAPVGLDAAPESFGAAFSAAGKRPHLIDVIGIIAAGKLRLEWAYSSAVYDPATIEYLANSYADALRGIIAHCKSPDAGGYTPSDFPLAGLDNDALSQVLMQVEFDTD